MTCYHNVKTWKRDVRWKKANAQSLTD